MSAFSPFLQFRQSRSARAWPVARGLFLGALGACLLSGATLDRRSTVDGASWMQEAEAAIVERVVAIVGEQAILLSDVRERARPFLVRIYAEVPEGPQRAAAMSQVFKVVLDRMIDEELEDRAAARSGIVVTAQEVDQALSRIASQNGMTQNQILAEAKRSGMSIKHYRDELRRQVLQAKMTSMRLQGRIRVDESEVLAEYRDLRREERLSLPQRTVRIVLRRGSTEAEQKAQQALAEDIVSRARAGEDFRQLLERYAEGTESGLAAALPPAQEPEAIRRATLGLEVGEVSRPIRLGTQLVILQVIERSPSSLPEYDAARPIVHEKVYGEKMAKARDHWIKGLRRRTHIEIRM